MSEQKKVAIRLSVVMEYDAGSLEGDALRFWLEENHCVGNVVHALDALVKTDDAQSVCNVCRFAKVELLPEGTEAYRGHSGGE